MGLPKESVTVLLGNALMPPAQRARLSQRLAIHAHIVHCERGGEGRGGVGLTRPQPAHRQVAARQRREARGRARQPAAGRPAGRRAGRQHLRAAGRTCPASHRRRSERYTAGGQPHQPHQPGLSQDEVEGLVEGSIRRRPRRVGVPPPLRVLLFGPVRLGGPPVHAHCKRRVGRAVGRVRARSARRAAARQQRHTALAAVLPCCPGPALHQRRAVGCSRSPTIFPGSQSAATVCMASE